MNVVVIFSILKKNSEDLRDFILFGKTIRA